MADSVEKVKENYAENLKAEAYLSAINGFWGSVPDLLRSTLVFIHEVFQSGRFKGSKLLEIGSAATVHGVASASAHFSSIVMSDYVEDNVEYLKLWLRGESDWKHFLDTPAELEGYGNDLETGRKMLEDRIRKTVKRVTRCDVMTDGILVDESSDPETSPPFDMIITCFVLECAPIDLDGYFAIFKRISAILKPGGGFLVCGTLEGEPWKIEDKEFHHFKVNENDVKRALTEAGFGNITFKTLSNTKPGEVDFTFEKFYCAVAEKL